MSFFSAGMARADDCLLKLFGEEHDIQGRTICAVLDYDEYRKKTSGRVVQPMEGLFTSGAVLFCRRDDLGFRPETGELLNLDGEPWIIASCEEGEKLLTLTLEQNRS